MEEKTLSNILKYSEALNTKVLEAHSRKINMPITANVEILDYLNNFSSTAHIINQFFKTTEFTNFYLSWQRNTRVCQEALTPAVSRLLADYDSSTKTFAKILKSTAVQELVASYQNSISQIASILQAPAWQRFLESSVALREIYQHSALEAFDKLSSESARNDDFELPQPVQQEIENTLDEFCRYIIAWCERHNVPQKIKKTIYRVVAYFFLAWLPILYQEYKSKESQEHADKLLGAIKNEIQLCRETFEQNMPQVPKGYIRIVKRKMKFTTSSNHIIWLSVGTQIIIENDNHKNVYGAAVVDGKFIKGYGLKKYTVIWDTANPKSEMATYCTTNRENE